MSFLETGKSRLNWLPTQAQTPLHPEPGCVQCGSRLETAGAINFTGKCFNCASMIFDGDEPFDELED